MLDLQPILHEQLDDRFKGYPPGAPALALSAVGHQGWNVLGEDLPFPIPVLKQSALAHNETWMRDFTAAVGVSLCPHGKTTMSPQLFERQLAAGAWGITVATVHQLGIAYRHGVRRFILANQLVGRQDIGHLAALSEHDPTLEVLFLVDDEAQVERFAVAAEAAGSRHQWEVLLEVGVEDGRTGCRDMDHALTVARAVAACRRLRLRGIECFEGLRASPDQEANARFVEGLMALLREVATNCAAEILFDTDEIILTAGGSAFFDLVARKLPLAELGRPYRVILRSGCYITHDSGFYRHLFAALQERLGADWQSRPGLRPALEVWAQVQSRPQPNLALLTLGKRDASYDIELPHPTSWYRPGCDTAPQPTPAQWRVKAMNDHHAYLEIPPQATLAIGDLVGCGISHPCTTFDRWQWLPVVDDSYTVIHAVRTYF